MRFIKKMNIIRAVRNNVYYLGKLNTAATLRAKEKIPGREKIYLPKQSHVLFPANVSSESSACPILPCFPAILYDGSWGHEPWRGRQIISVYYFIDACQVVWLGNSF